MKTDIFWKYDYPMTMLILNLRTPAFSQEFLKCPVDLHDDHMYYANALTFEYIRENQRACVYLMSFSEIFRYSHQYPMVRESHSLPFEPCTTMVYDYTNHIPYKLITFHNKMFVLS